MTIDRMQVREAMRAAARRLELRVDGDGVPIDFRVEQFASTISAFVGGAEIPDTREPRRAGKVRVENELSVLCKHAEKLKEAISTVSPVTVQALWDAPTLRTQDGEMYRTDVGKLLDRLSFDLAHLYEVARHAPIIAADVGETRGNRADLWAAGVIRTSAWHYERMTGREIDQSRDPGSFHTLLAEVFASLGIERSVEAAVRRAKQKAWS